MTAASKEGLFIVISAPSGTGKSTVCERLLGRRRDMKLSISVTTRAPRGQERDGIDYHFVDKTGFYEMVRADAFLEWANVHGNQYGTPRRPIEEWRMQGFDVLLDIDVQGGLQVATKVPDLVTILLLPPTWAELERRLLGRGTNSAEDVARRLARGRDEVEEGAAYRYAVVNDDLERSLGEIDGILAAERERARHRAAALRALIG